LAVTGVGVYAGLAANAVSSAQTITSGTLKLTMADNGAGFSSTVSNMAPGDVVNRYVDLTNSGTLAGQTLTLAATDSGSSLLSTDATKGLHVIVSQCSGTWAPTTGVCSTGGGGTTTLLASTALSAMSSAQTLVSGAIAISGVYHLQVQVTLPNQSETSTNGTLPGGTIQGLTATLTWTFDELQRTATTTNS